MDKVFIPPTTKQKDYAYAISKALRDGADLYHMDKWEMRDYISKSLQSEESRKKLAAYNAEHNAEMWQHHYEERRRKFDRPYLTDESLGGDWGLDASDFGMQAWGDS